VIRTIEEVVALSAREAEAEPLLAEEMLLRTPGTSNAELAQIRTALPGLPESYLTVAAQVLLPNAAIGYVQLAPGEPDGGGLVERLVHANSPASPLWAFLDQRQLYHIADYEGDMICVVRDGQPKAGEIARIDLSCPPTPELHRTAWTFEQFLIGFGRLREQFVEERFGPDAIDAVLASLVDDFHFDEEQFEDWTWFAEVALGEDEDTPGDPWNQSSAWSQSPEATKSGPAGPSTPQKTAERPASKDLNADVVSEYQRPVPEGFDAFAAIPTWPDWQVDNFVQGDGSLTRSYWSRFEGQVYKLTQRPRPYLDESHELYAVMAPQIVLVVVKGTPKPRSRDWDLRKVATYPLPGLEPWVEAQVEIAAYRRRLPELLAELPANKKSKT
jgi:hypothetical protein